jgi:murein DD-endopeptidase MepM/ murein hydrolase activator NlpD
LLLAVFFWGIYFYKSLQYDQALSSKYSEIDELKKINSYFANELKISQEKLEKINQYLNAINGPVQNVNDQQPVPVPQSIQNKQLNEQDEQTLNTIKSIHQKFANIQAFNKNRIKKIEEAIKITGLNIKKPKIATSNNNLDDSDNFTSKFSSQFTFQGGPDGINKQLEIELLSKKLSKDYIELHLEKNNFNSEIDQLAMLEKIANSLPLSKPMQNFYISSGFGIRIDPITGKHHPHEGLDFVGISNAKIISPSTGKVVLAKWFSDYGNAIVIDHGYGVTTRYGHLSKIKVKEGDVVKKGQIIALQGNTGRSTGHHLHYEVRYKNTPLNPKRFLEAGNLINSSNPAYVNS